jgi:hypothetical protein
MRVSPVTAPAEVLLSTASMAVAPGIELGDITITESATLETDGTFRLRDGAALSVNSRAAGRRGDVLVSTRIGDMAGESVIVTQSQGRSTGGKVDIRAERVQLAEGSFIGTEARNNGRGGESRSWRMR